MGRADPVIGLVAQQVAEWFGILPHFFDRDRPEPVGIGAYPARVVRNLETEPPVVRRVVRRPMKERMVEDEHAAGGKVGLDGLAPPNRMAWADLLQRVFEVDALRCPQCGGRMRILSAITEPDVARRILDSLDMPSRAPPLGAVRRQPDGRDEDSSPDLPWGDDPGFDFDQSDPGG